MNFPTEVLELVFYHLQAQDLLACTLVSPNWNHIISASRRCMKKLQIKVTLNELLKKGGYQWKARTYSNISIFGNLSYPEFPSRAMECLMSKETAWTKVEIGRVTFRKQSMFVEFLEAFKTTLKVLVLFDVTVKDEDDASSAKKLKLDLMLLVLGFANLPVIRCFVNCDNLVHLDYYGYRRDQKLTHGFIKYCLRHLENRKISMVIGTQNQIFIKRY